MADKNVLDWLLETGSPGVRYLALRDIVKAGGEKLVAAGEGIKG